MCCTFGLYSALRACRAIVFRSLFDVVNPEAHEVRQEHVRLTVCSLG